MIEGELLRRLDRIEAMLEGLCMGMASNIPKKENAEEKPRPPKTALQVRREFAEYVGMAAYSYAKYPSTTTITARVEVDGGYYMEATSRVPPLFGPPPPTAPEGDEDTAKE